MALVVAFAINRIKKKKHRPYRGTCVGGLLAGG
jgi:hypothetical protein